MDEVVEDEEKESQGCSVTARERRRTLMCKHGWNVDGTIAHTDT